MNADAGTLDCLIIGAGISGLLAAGELQRSGLRVRVIDKGRGPGGRIATRRIDGGTFDHGAQFFTVRDPRFRKLVEKWVGLGIAAPWANGFPAPGEKSVENGHPRYRGTPGMTAIPKFLAEGLPLEQNVRAAAIRQTNTGWETQTDSGRRINSRSLLVTPPVPQTLALLEEGEVSLPKQDWEALRRIAYDPCIALLIVADAPSRLLEPGAVRFDTGDIRWIADNRLKGVSRQTALTIHTSPAYSRSRWDTDPENIAEEILQLASDWLDTKSVRAWQVQKWRFSQPRTIYPEQYLAIEGRYPLVFAGDAFGGPRVEGAALSGLAAADFLLGWTAARRA